ncbi:MAG TPA: serine/threonine-protein kinase [Polyangiaceae bacterium]|jgi:serine/threonine-protein kinase
MEKALEQRIVGTTVAGKYRVRRIIGAGSMGIVCEAEHLEIGKRLAIKIIDASLAGMSDIAMRFRQEARAASLVESQHIVQVFDVGTDDQLGLYLVMEYLTGEDLSAALARQKRFEANEAVRIAVQVARGLAKAHEAGVVHRDLKPANIFLTEREDDDPLVKILDFGISKVIDASRADSKLKLTRAGTVVGTPQYMSPEQAQGYSVDERTDVWALGLVLYEMLAGRPAYQELPTYEAFIIHLVSHPPDPLARVAPWVPAPLAKVVHQAIEHDMAKRIGSCMELARRLLDANPLHGVRGVGMSAQDMADTWADPASMSPYADHTPQDERPALEERIPSSRTTGKDHAPEDSLTIDVDVPMEAAPPSAVKAQQQAADGVLARSGVRVPSEPAEDASDEAPQFFDRKSLETLDKPPSGPRGGEVAPDSRQATTAKTQTKDLVAHAAAMAAVEPKRFPLGWMALAFIALGLVVVAALAFR